MSENIATPAPEAETLITFPCQFPFKVMGMNNDSFERNMLDIIAQYISEAPSKVSRKPSKTGKYLALTITFTASSKTQLDNIYGAINSHPDVRMML